MYSNSTPSQPCQFTLWGTAPDTHLWAPDAVLAVDCSMADECIRWAGFKLQLSE
jgi:hypothetical protein